MFRHRLAQRRRLAASAVFPSARLRLQAFRDLVQVKDQDCVAQAQVLRYFRLWLSSSESRPRAFGLCAFGPLW